MKLLKRKFTSAFALFVLLMTGQLASAFYDPSLGRWINRDPVEEIAFQNQTATHRSTDYFNGNLYWFIANDTGNKLDSWGLEITFNGCSTKHQGDIRKAISDNCEKAKACSGCRLSAGSINNLCGDNPDITFNCRDANWVSQGTGQKCAGSCGLTPIGVRGINICPDAEDPAKCGPLGCTIFHEVLHTDSGFPAKHSPDHSEFDKCMGCKVTY